jgi:hypothetical protein
MIELSFNLNNHSMKKKKKKNGKKWKGMQTNADIIERRKYFEANVK